jgi:hypothetical protein
VNLCTEPVLENESVELAYFPETADAWPADARVIVLFATLLGCFGVLNVTAEAILWAKPAIFSTVAGWTRGSNQIVGITVEGCRLLASALLVAGGAAFFNRKRAARKLLVAGAALMLIPILIGAALYWYYMGVQATQLAPAKTPAADWILRVVWQGEHLAQNCAVPIILLLVMTRPDVKARFNPT